MKKVISVETEDVDDPTYNDAYTGKDGYKNIKGPQINQSSPTDGLLTSQDNDE